MNLTYAELLRVTEQSHTRNNQPGFIPAWQTREETILHMPQGEQDWQDAVLAFQQGLKQ